ncbi:hypothetical protein HAHE_14230 [Haloferula helveola]|uniref:BD-FAE-like domain-containing protein n=1 Tax=Haloferula helveola TaxID=490095 RepID=A0ABM7RAZ6_9BACT|nr:hypothetical protein HAHE_14230 [Haloferula helveola]
MNRLSILAPLIVAAACSLASAEVSEPLRVPLWPGEAPVSRDGTEREKAEVWMTVHRPEKPNGTAMVICPGGGYGGLVTGGEGHGIAKWLGGHGITGVVLEYRLPKGRPFVPSHDSSRAIRTVRSRAAEWQIKPDRIGIIGFSAGGHLAATTLVHFTSGDSQASDPVEHVSSRPDFGILVYPVVSMGEHTHGGSRQRLLGKEPSDELLKYFSPELQVTKATPPVFLTHALDDKVVVPENSRLLHQALVDKGVASRLLELPSGGHGLNGYKGPMWDKWQKESLEWLRELKLMP